MNDLLSYKDVSEYPLLQAVLQKYSSLSISDYIDLLLENTETRSGLLPAYDLAKAAEEYLFPIVGKETAKMCAEQLVSQPILLTANHHFPEYADSVIQGNYLYGEFLRRWGFSSKIQAVISFGNMSMDFVEFPRGMQIYNHQDAKRNSSPLKIPVYPIRKTMIAVAPPWNADRVEFAIRKLEQYTINGTLQNDVAESATKLLRKCYMSEETLGQQDYLRQATVVNRRMGKLYFHDEETEQLYIPAEELVNRILIDELGDESSLTYRMLFKHCKNVLQHLDGVTGCWKLDRTAGSMFFWGVDEEGRRVPLFICEESGSRILKGANSIAHSVSVPFDPEHIIAAIESKRLVPGLFLIFLELTFLRGYTVMGAKKQGTYLNEMADRLAEILNEMQDSPVTASEIRSIKFPYLSGPVLSFGNAGNKHYRLGPVELMDEDTYDIFRKGLNLTMAEGISNHFRVKQ